MISVIASTLSRALNRIGSLAAARYRAALALLIVYQAVMYGFLSRMYLHVSVVLLPWLINQPGYQLYSSINFGYPPGYLWLNAALYRLIPDPNLRLRLGTILIAAAITLMVFAQARRWWTTQAGLLAALLFALWGPLMLDYLLYFEFALGLLALGALMIWQRYADAAWRPFAAGLLVGLMILVKQPAMAVLAAFVVWRLIGGDWRAAARDLLRFGGGVILPLALTAAILAAQGVLSRALFLMTAYNSPYTALGIEPPSLSDLLLLALWLGLLPLFVYSIFRQRESRRTEGILLVGLLIALLFPAYPRYGRFHVSGALPMVALMSAGALESLARLRSRLLGVYAASVLLIGMGIALALPLYYRLKLGPITSEYQALIPLSDWTQRETKLPPGSRLWILPDIDPTSNFYPISGYDPPAFYTNTYSWFFAWPDLRGRVIAGLESDPPAYVVVVDNWQYQIDAGLWQYVEQHYRLAAETRISDELGDVTLYRRNP